MSAMRRFVRRLAGSVLGQSDDGRVQEELAEHLALLTEEYVRAGAPPDEAHRRAKLKLGALAATTAACRDEQRLRWLEDLGMDLRYGARSLWRNPGFGVVAILTLGLGIGANLAIFALVNAVLIRPLPFRQPGELMSVHLLVAEHGAPGVFGPTIWSYPKYEVVRDGQHVFTATSLYASREWSVTGSGEAERIRGEVVEASYFPLLGVDARVGRTFVGADDTIGAAPVVVISHALWQRRFGSDPTAVGKVVRIDGTPATIIGVAPPGFRGMAARADMWRPLKPTAPYDLTEPGSHSYHQLARRRPQVTIEQAEAAVRALGAQIDTAFPVATAAGQTGVTAVPLDDERIEPVLRRAALILLGAAGVVLLIACVNLANLTLARGVARQREVAIRLAVGAGRLRIVRQFLTESLFLSLAGTLAGVVIAAASIRAASAAIPDLSQVLDGQRGGLLQVGVSMLGVDTTMVLAAVGLAVVTAVIFGLIPARQAAQHDLTTATKSASGGGRSMGVRTSVFRNGLMIGEVVLAFVMLVSAGLMLKSMMRLSQIDLGFRPDRVLTFRLELPDQSYPPERSVQFIEQLLTRVKSRSDVEAVAFGHCAPVSDGCNGTRAFLMDRPPPQPGRDPMVGVTWVSPDYFDALGIGLVRGRSFTAQDRQGQPKVVLVNETAARQFWGREDPVGKRLGIGQGGFRDGAEVIGVVADVRYRAVEAPPGPDVYVPVLQSPRSRGVFFVRSRLSAAALVPMIRHQLGSLDRDVPLDDVKTMDERYGEATWRTWTIGVLLSIFAGLALVLALVGVFSVLAQAVAQRTREIGVRIAIGAAPRDIKRLVLGRAVMVATAGVGIGLVVAWFAARLLAALLYEVEPTDPSVLLSTALVLFVVAVMASYVPARRAAHVNPLETIRFE